MTRLSLLQSLTISFLFQHMFPTRSYVLTRPRHHYSLRPFNRLAPFHAPKYHAFHGYGQETRSSLVKALSNATSNQGGNAKSLAYAKGVRDQVVAEGHAHSAWGGHAHSQGRAMSQRGGSSFGFGVANGGRRGRALGVGSGTSIGGNAIGIGISMGGGRFQGSGGRGMAQVRGSANKDQQSSHRRLSLNYLL
ncbi:protein no-on-transient A-like [Tigriopus californicus]|uniref:protein no-on-transient A-like n=1 Tax=Tigriopus californicus TaxID=6832 RepID=UPI0027DA1EA1|nr:protein no-on-transient A-like [Tigriopus californicus]